MRRRALAERVETGRDSRSSSPLTTQTVLLTGATGRLGARLRVLLRHEMNVLGISRWQIDDNSIIQVTDPLDPAALDRVWREVRPEFCIHASAIADPDKCELNRPSAIEANVLYTSAVCFAALRWKTRVLFTSTDYVFDGTKSIYFESDSTSPVQFYGETKVVAEKLVAKLPGSIIFRLPLLYSPGARMQGNFIAQVMGTLEQNRVVTECAERIRYPLYSDDLADVVLGLFRKEHSGIYHISGPTGVTRWAWAKLVAELAGFDQSLVKSRSATVKERGAVRPMTIRLDTSKLNRILNLRLNSLKQGTEQVLSDYHGNTSH